MKITFSAFTAAAVLGAMLARPAFADDNAAAFKALDVDGDGFISEQEATAHEDLPDAFSDGDENNDGQLDPAEFANLEITDE